MFGSIVFDFGVIALNFGSGEGGGQGARARPSLGSSARPCSPCRRTKSGAIGARLSHQKLEFIFFLTIQFFFL